MSSTLLDRWIPAYVYIHSTELIAKFQTKTGLWVLYPEKVYALPPRLKILTKRSALEILEETVVSTSSRYPGDLEKRTIGVFDIIERKETKVLTRGYKVKLKPGAYIVRVREDGNIHVLPPDRPTNPKYKLIIVATPFRRTGMGGSTYALFNAEPIYRTRNESGTGNHGIDYNVFIIPKEKKLVALLVKVSNRGNASNEVIVFDSEVSRKPRYEERDAKAFNNDWVVMKRVYDNWEGRERVLVELYYHEARKTSAATTHEIEPPDALEPVFLGDHGGVKTHWVEIYEVRKPVKITTVRISNSGKRYVYTATINP